MLDIDVAVTNEELLTNYQTLLQHLPEFTADIVTRAAFEDTQSLQQALEIEPGAPKYPIRWTSAKQRRYYFASHKGRIPYQRTHALSKGYKVALTFGEEGAIAAVTVENPASALPFVKGEFQQSYHQDTGWSNDANTYAIYEAKMTEDIETALIQAWLVQGASTNAKRYGGK